MEKRCIICNKPLKTEKMFCSQNCKSKSQKGHTPWNKGLTKEDPRVKKTIDASTKTIRRQYKNGRKSWITGRTKENEPILAKIALENSVRTKQQYLKTGQAQWFADRKNFNRKGATNSEYQKEQARKAIFNSIIAGKIIPKRSKAEIKLEAVLEDLNIRYLPSFLMGYISLVDFYLPDYEIILYCDGVYYHSLLSVRDRDIRERIQLTEFGFKVVRITDAQINDHSFQELKELVYKMIENA